MVELIPITDITGPQGPPGFNATGAAEDQETIAAYISEDAGSNPVSEALRKKYERSVATEYPVWVYGNSLGVLAAPYFTSGRHWTQLLAERLGIEAAVTSYAVGARRTVDVAYTLVDGVNGEGVTGVIAAGKWPGVSSRRGIVVLETLGNDIGHYPAMNVSPVVPQKITTANDNYLSSMEGLYRSAIALVSSQSRIEQTAATFTGTWAGTNTPLAGASGGTIAFTNSPGAAIEYTVTPPQSGPLRGKVHFLFFRLAAFATPDLEYSIDGVPPAPGQSFLPQPDGRFWEAYTGHNGSQVPWAHDCITIDLPVDGDPHTIKVIHTGTGSEYLYADCLLVPSETPNPVIVPGHNTPPNVHANVFDQDGVDAWRYNEPRVRDRALKVVDEFPNAIYVPSNISSNGLYSGDGLHPNDRGMEQRAADVYRHAAPLLAAQFEARTLELKTDGQFGVV